MPDVFDRHRVAAGGRPRTCTLSWHHQVAGNRHDNRRSLVGAQVHQHRGVGDVGTQLVGVAQVITTPRNGPGARNAPIAGSSAPIGTSVRRRGVALLDTRAYLGRMMRRSAGDDVDQAVAWSSRKTLVRALVLTAALTVAQGCTSASAPKPSAAPSISVASAEGVQSCPPRPEGDAAIGGQFVSFTTRPVTTHVGLELVIRPPDGTPADWTIMSVNPTNHVCRMSKANVVNTIEVLMTTSAGSTTLTARSKDGRHATLTLLTG